MSDAPAEAGEFRSIELPVPLATFAATLRSRVVETHVNGRPKRIMPGEPDEVYVRLLKARHGRERHTPTEWRALVDDYRNQPAHPADSRYAESRT